MHGSSLGIICKEHGLMMCLWWVGKQQCLQHGLNSLMYLLAKSISLWIFSCGQNQFNGKQAQQLLKIINHKISPIIMDALHWSRISRELRMLKASSNMVTRFFENPSDFSCTVKASESKEFYNIMWC